MKNTERLPDAEDNSRPAFSAVVFDVFGTLVQIGDRRSPYRMLMHWMRDAGRRPRPEDAARLMSQPVPLSAVGPLFGVALPDDLLATAQRALDDEVRSLRLFPDATTTIARLRDADVRVGLCSNLASPYGDAVKGMLPVLDGYAWSYEAGAVKPNPAIYQYILDQLGCPVQEVLFIGDTPAADVDGPRAFGMNARLIDRKAGQSLDALLTDLLY
ncbi:haloacid dehalogenase superfamily, subfamily IA, variant 3 with third motif having DD or ED/haloacid dehalogenase superfamily, subfamily IA, variant 1 with third motif having Dx(3-4)D or Dx(3-4)E [Paraburkholderia fungorum]|uniref:Haloacid dehalogenase superfamily, subfamily IA, variant 3 with third motif having DD or ED/haloacid dehalogenase superfamily, subfamily IA, variant 1 with third motif having Dx(3-4)D or Dx(3-4)E n=1 Tax=Paraburkholderia fungorum TaxID=134537 RepID=A0A1H1JMY5_9BURK|nr:haloacid dehalogenase superfamily, subfamily IA, variant 3 with third motif having DD or ED/haloacid dehalogenase superfamily, subfamily IA, variant 1 with third motif having Dx(3-4)D or Dx(3-4)E [Paraburkholderia fungorum]